MSKETKLLANRLPLTDEQIRTHTVGALKPLSSRILIVDYDPQWPELFGREAVRIRAGLFSLFFLDKYVCLVAHIHS
jgi:hypothetical protein